MVYKFFDEKTAGGAVKNENYTWVISLKDKKGITIIIAFQKTLDESGSQPKRYG